MGASRHVKNTFHEIKKPRRLLPHALEKSPEVAVAEIENIKTGKKACPVAKIHRFGFEQTAPGKRQRRTARVLSHDPHHDRSIEKLRTMLGKAHEQIVFGNVT